MTLPDLLLATLVMAIWGFNFVVAKVGVGELDGLLLTGLRFALVAALLIPFYRPHWRQMKTLAMLSVTLGVVHFGLLFVGLQGIDAATSAIVIQLQVPFSALLAFLLFKERLGIGRFAGMALAFLGVVLLAGEPQRIELFGLVLVVISALGFALSTMVMKSTGGMHPLAITGGVCLLGAPQLLLLSAIFETGQFDKMANASWIGWGAVAYTAIFASVVAHSLWYRLVRRYPVNVIVPFSLLAPVLGILSSIAILGEPFGLHKAMGAVCTLSGVALIQYLSTRKPA
ncbi:Permease of the drug/metabolite transporter (DMT) superfamily [Rhodospirillaceae bacterium LM-1]|nr:Permease of the drug/metabolite transporter (DMT) superfamily [Rhodospirillaceae bacterium LM-1]